MIVDISLLVILNLFQDRLKTKKRTINTKSFGIIGYPLEHSFSADYFNKKFAEEGLDAHYRLYPIPSLDGFLQLIQEHSFTGLNVTLPYKETIMPYLDELDDTAAKIGAVNVIHFTEKRLVGYNTDTIGFRQSVEPLLRPYHTHALILGTGGAAKAVAYALRRTGIECQFVSRHAAKGITYAQLSRDILKQHLLIVNCTPLGMFPAVDACPPIPYQYLTDRHLVYDVIYNPAQTLFLRQASMHGAVTCNGIGMLYGQATAAWKIWTENR